MVQVYTGNGKGKSTAALGQVLRAMGHGYRAVIIQFLKGGGYTGEVLAAKKFLPRLEIKQFGKPCTYSHKKERGEECGNCRDCFLTREEEVEWAHKALNYARKVASSGEYDLVVLDEINVILARRLLSVEEVLELIKNKHPETELILTGQRAPLEIIRVADLVTEMRKLKHPFDKGIYGRRGIEY